MAAFNAAKRLEHIRDELDQLFRYYHKATTPVSVEECLFLEDIRASLPALRATMIRADSHNGIDQLSIGVKHQLKPARVSQIKRFDMPPHRWRHIGVARK